MSSALLYEPEKVTYWTSLFSYKFTACIGFIWKCWANPGAEFSKARSKCFEITGVSGLSFKRIEFPHKIDGTS